MPGGSPESESLDKLREMLEPHMEHLEHLIAHLAEHVCEVCRKYYGTRDVAPLDEEHWHRDPWEDPNAVQE